MSKDSKLNYLKSLQYRMQVREELAQEAAAEGGTASRHYGITRGGVPFRSMMRPQNTVPEQNQSRQQQQPRPIVVRCLCEGLKPSTSPTISAAPEHHEKSEKEGTVWNQEVCSALVRLVKGTAVDITNGDDHLFPMMRCTTAAAPTPPIGWVPQPSTMAGSSFQPRDDDVGTEGREGDDSQRSCCCCCSCARCAKRRCKSFSESCTCTGTDDAGKHKKKDKSRSHSSSKKHATSDAKTATTTACPPWYAFRPFRELEIFDQLAAKYSPTASKEKEEKHAGSDAAATTTTGVPPSIIIHCCGGAGHGSAAANTRSTPPAPPTAASTVPSPPAGVSVPLPVSTATLPPVSVVPPPPASVVPPPPTSTVPLPAVSTIPPHPTSTTPSPPTSAIPPPSPMPSVPPPPLLAVPVPVPPAAAVTKAAPPSVSADKKSLEASAAAPASPTGRQLAIEREKLLLDRANRYVESLEEEVEHRALHLDVTTRQLAEEEARSIGLRGDRDALLELNRQLESDNVAMQAALDRAAALQEGRRWEREYAGWPRQPADGWNSNNSSPDREGKKEVPVPTPLPPAVQAVYTQLGSVALPQAVHTPPRATAPPVAVEQSSLPLQASSTSGAVATITMSEDPLPKPSVPAVVPPPPPPPPVQSAPPPAAAAAAAPVHASSSLLPQGPATAPASLEAAQQEVMKHLVLSREAEARQRAAAEAERDCLRHELLSRADAQQRLLSSASPIGAAAHSDSTHANILRRQHYADAKLADLERYVDHLWREAQANSAYLQHAASSQPPPAASSVAPVTAMPFATSHQPPHHYQRQQQQMQQHPHMVNSPVAQQGRAIVERDEQRRGELERLRSDIRSEGVRLDEESQRWRAYLQSQGM